MSAQTIDYKPGMTVKVVPYQEVKFDWSMHYVAGEVGVIKEVQKDQLRIIFPGYNRNNSLRRSIRSVPWHVHPDDVRPYYSTDNEKSLLLLPSLEIDVLEM